MSLYLWIDILSVSVPFLVSFHPRIALYKKWKPLFFALLLTLIPFVIWDVFFTIQGFWGFNEKYLSGIYLFHLPLEEWLFFICIPYACVFTHVAILKIDPNFALSDSTAQRVTLILFVIFGGLLFFNLDKAYTVVDMIFALIILGFVKQRFAELLPSFYLTFLFMLVPFFIVNGILTGSGIDEQVVWYDDQENLGIRLGTIPLEDIVYAFSMILMNLFLFSQFSARHAKTELKG